MVRLSDREPGLVLCSACSSLRLERIKFCFCGETETRPAPPPATEKKTLFPDERRARMNVPRWKAGEAVRWKNGESWWYGVVIRQKGDRVQIRAIARWKGSPDAPPDHEARTKVAKEKVGWRPMDAIERDE